MNQAFNQSKLTFEQLNNETHLGFAQIVNKLEATSTSTSTSKECETRSQLLSQPITSHSQTNASFENIDSHLDRALKDLTNSRQNVELTLPSYIDELIAIDINDNVHVNHFFKYNQLDLLDSLLEGSNVLPCDTNVDNVDQQDPPAPPSPTIKIFDNRQENHLSNEIKDMEKQPSPLWPVVNTFDIKQKDGLSNENKNMTSSAPPPTEKRTKRSSTPSQKLAIMASVAPAPPLKSKPVKRTASFDKENLIPSKKIKIEVKDEVKKPKKLSSKDVPSKCGECQKTLSTPRSLARHINAIHKQNKVVKKVKDEAVEMEVSPAASALDDDDEKSSIFKCDLCTKSFTRENTFAAHIKSFHWHSDTSVNAQSRRRSLRN